MSFYGKAGKLIIGVAGGGVIRLGCESAALIVKAVSSDPAASAQKAKALSQAGKVVFDSALTAGEKLGDGVAAVSQGVGKIGGSAGRHLAETAGASPEVADHWEQACNIGAKIGFSCLIGNAAGVAVGVLATVVVPLEAFSALSTSLEAADAAQAVAGLDAAQSAGAASAALLHQTIAVVKAIAAGAVSVDEAISFAGNAGNGPSPEPDSVAAGRFDGGGAKS